MAPRQYFKSSIFRISSDEDFIGLCLQLFRYQAAENKVYNAYLKALGTKADSINEVEQIPFLPISFFKSHHVKTASLPPVETFTSSGTTGDQASRHFVGDLELYERSFIQGFQRLYGSIPEYCVLALLPGYLERKGSSLIYMAERMIQISKDADSGFYLNEFEDLHRILLKKIKAGQKVLLLGVTFALLDFAERYSLPQSEIIIMETGGMKGRRREIIRSEVHRQLMQSLGVATIHSEYGMTELLSQAYSKGEGRFVTPPWMKVLVREVDDPFSPAREGKTGGINVIDLANIDSCAFIETQDLGRLYDDASFEVMGRFDNSDIRGCNLMVI